MLAVWRFEVGLVCIQVPFRHFLVSTAVGLQPANIMLVHAGSSLTRLHSWRDLCAGPCPAIHSI